MQRGWKKVQEHMRSNVKERMDDTRLKMRGVTGCEPPAQPLGTPGASKKQSEEFVSHWV
jgi:hypothetical protein